jgi:hypothetical protein
MLDTIRFVAATIIIIVSELLSAMFSMILCLLPFRVRRTGRPRRPEHGR